MRNRAASQNWPKITLCKLSFCFRLARIVTKVKLEENTVPIFLLLKTGVKTLCATAVLLRIGVFCWTTWQNILTACAKQGAQLKIYLSWCDWTIISKKLWFAVLDKTWKKQRAQPCCCSKLATSQTAQLSFCFRLGCIVRKLKPVRNSVRNCPVKQNWCLLL